MRKVLTFAFALILGMGIAQAQDAQGESAVGAKLLYGSEIKSMGLGVDFQYCVIDHLRAEVGFNYFFEHNHTKWMDVNLNAHYLVGLWNHQLFIYPLAGLNYTMTKVKYPESYEIRTIETPSGEITEGPVLIPSHSDEDNHIGMNVGAGVEYMLNDRFSASLEYRHTIVRKVDQGVFGFNIHYHF